MITIDDTLPKAVTLSADLFLGSGIAREVYVDPRDPGFVLKCTEHYGGQPNRQAVRECEMWEVVQDSPFAHLFAPITSRTSDFRVVRMRRSPGVPNRNSSFFADCGFSHALDACRDWLRALGYEYPIGDLHYENCFEVGEGRWLIHDYGF